MQSDSRKNRTEEAAEVLPPAGNGPNGARRSRSVVRRALIGNGLFGMAAALLGSAASATRAAAQPPNGPPADHTAGPLGSATISFGSWMIDPPLDRHPNAFPRPANHHEMCPAHVTVKAGACVNFIIAGVHQVVIYDDGTQPGDIDTSLLIAATNPLPSPLIADPSGRVYRGLDPSVAGQERVEVVHFDRPGTYLVICGVLRHFEQGMYGFITVLP